MVTEEELKDMTPEQIAELQKRNCICCLISQGKVSSKIIYDDDKCVAVLEINPANPGHIILFPREHYIIMPQVPADLVGYLFTVAKHLSQACLRALKVEGANIFCSNGALAGQRVPHFMIEIIPRKEKDGLDVFNIKHNEIPESDLNETYKRLRKKVNEVFKLGEEVVEAEFEEKEEREIKEEGEGREVKKQEIKKEKIKGKKAKESRKKGKSKNGEEKEEVSLDDIAGLLK